MNGAELPFLNGYPLRLVVPGYFGTYWIKHVSDIQVLDTPFQGFWMSTAYRIPDNPCACVEPGATPSATKPIGRFTVRSFITSLQNEARVPANRETVARGIAFDGGQGIAEVTFSSDAGATWQPARLGTNHGRYSFHEWTARFTPAKKGRLELQVRATSRSGETQPLTASWNPAGYMRNVVETVKVVAV
jgi:DMSO/TMAO reductase YedYZ molybdopterin-dependent catalytic subunit